MKAAAALVVGKRRRQKAVYNEDKLAKQLADVASDGDGAGGKGDGDAASDADCVPTQNDSDSSDSDSDEEGAQV